MAKKTNKALNYKINDFLRDNGLKIGFFASLLGITKQGLQYKMDRGITEEESATMLNVLKLWVTGISKKIPQQRSVFCKK